MSRRKGYSSKNYECLFDDENQITIADLFTRGEVLRYRTKTITSGPIVECEIFPIWKSRSEVKKAREYVTPEAQRAVNERNAKKTIIRKINTNFTSEDVVCHLTYAGDPPNLDEARKDIRNYIRRIKDFRRRYNLPEMKYIYVIEFDDGETGRPKRIHQHIIMSAIDRDIAEGLWGKGRANCDRLKPDEYGLEALARYMVKDPRGVKRWAGSRNLSEPIVTVADHKVSKRQVERIALEFEESGGIILSQKFPGCNLLEIATKRSDYVSGVYVYAKMRKPQKIKGPIEKRSEGAA